MKIFFIPTSYLDKAKLLVVAEDSEKALEMVKKEWGESAVLGNLREITSNTIGLVASISEVH